MFTETTDLEAPVSGRPTKTGNGSAALIEATQHG
jgi:hypothetical protein